MEGQSPADRCAPGRLELVQDFVNSADLERATDELSSPASASAWLGARGFDAAGVDGDAGGHAAVARLVAVREALRELLMTHNSPVEHTDAASRLTAAFAATPMHVAVEGTGPVLRAAGAGIDAFVGEIASRLLEASLEGTLERLKVCRDDGCRWAFYDSSKNARGAWCTMSSCGARAKARAYRSRRRAQGRAGAPAPA